MNLLLVLLLLLQAPTAEPDELNRILADAGNSAVDIIHGLEQFLQKYPQTARRAEIEKALAKSAMDVSDGPRILLYGEKVLQTPPDDLQLLDRVIRELVERKDPDLARKAIVYAKRYESDIAAMRKQDSPQHFTPGQWADQLDRADARAFALEAHAQGVAGNPEDAVKIAQKSWAACPTAEGALELANWFSKLNRDQDALAWFANAFTIEDSRTTETDRARDRVRMGELYAKINGSEKGMGDLILQAYDRNASLMSERQAKLKQKDPNAQAANVLDFTLPTLDGSPDLPLSSLKGKIVVVDFWATWCVPCRAQHPLIDNVKKRLANRSDVVFLAVDSDDDPSLVLPFLKEQGWHDGPVYFEDGLMRRLIIGSLPTVVVLNPAGRVSSRITGLVLERFEDLLAQRIQEAMTN